MNWRLLGLSLLATGCGTSIGTKTYDEDTPSDTDDTAIEDTAAADTAIEATDDNDDTADTDDPQDTSDTDDTETSSEENPNFGECDDELDNDADGLTDCEDEDCDICVFVVSLCQVYVYTKESLSTSDASTTQSTKESTSTVCGSMFIDDIIGSLFSTAKIIENPSTESKTLSVTTTRQIN